MPKQFYPYLELKHVANFFRTFWTEKIFNPQKHSPGHLRLSPSLMIVEIKHKIKQKCGDGRLLAHILHKLKICIISHQFWVCIDVFDLNNKRRRRLLVAVQPPTLKFFDLPVLGFAPLLMGIRLQALS